jgi:hypothetical protein
LAEGDGFFQKAAEGIEGKGTGSVIDAVTDGDQIRAGGGGKGVWPEGFKGLRGLGAIPGEVVDLDGGALDDLLQGGNATAD